MVQETSLGVCQHLNPAAVNCRIHSDKEQLGVRLKLKLFECLLKLVADSDALVCLELLPLWLAVAGGLLLQDRGGDWKTLHHTSH